MQVPEFISDAGIKNTLKNANCFWQGDFSHAITEFESFLEISVPELKFRRRLLFLFTELVQNTGKHSSDTEQSLVWVNSDGRNIWLHAWNPLTKENTEHLKEEFLLISQNSPEELKSIIKQRIMEGKYGTGLLEIARKSRQTEHRFFQHHNIQYIYLKLENHVKTSCSIK